ncbi:Coiled-coil domain-containing protein 42 [Clonorchis sinensis]|uniref:Coiled-coil domain-containing protein 42 n=1 Tax=Clonorchis sinensis TaxID=79923 RepID=A0A8T1MFJ6_CLOSI|nr:Coiled-coil domain-containing protein 42 [Clonorchis sinensis]
MDAKMAPSNSLHLDEEKYSSAEGLPQNAIVKVDNRLENLENINSTSLKVLEKHSQLRKLNEELKKEKNEFKRKMEELEQRWTIVKEKESIYRDSLVKFEKLLRDNDEKKLRALRKLVNERLLQKTNEVELEILRKRNKQLLSQRQRLENKVANLRKYQRFLQELVKRSEFFSEIPEVLSRYSALMANLEDLKSVDQLNNLCFEEISTHLRQYKEEKNDEKLSLTNELTSLRRRLEDSQTENRDRENLWAHARDNALQRVSELCELKGSVLNMYRTARRYEKYGEELSSENTVDQLEVIKDFILDLSEIVKELS